MNPGSDIIQKLNRIRELYEKYDYNSVLVLSCELINSFNEEIDSEVLIEVYQIISNIYFNKSDYVKAYEYSIKASELIEEYHSVDLALKNIIGISKLLIRQHAYIEAVQLLKKALNIANKYHVPKYETVIFNSLGSAYYGIKEYEKSVGVIENALDIAKKNNLSNQINEITLNLAKSHIALGTYSISKSYLDKVLKDIGEEEDYGILMKIYIMEANIAFEKKNYQDTIIFAFKAKDLAKKLEFNYELLISYEWLHKAYFQLNDYKNAYIYIEKYLYLQNKMLSKDKEENLLKMRIKYEVNQKNKEIKILQKNYDKAIKQKKELQYIIDIMGKQNEDLLEIATEDSLTGAYNRKYFILKLEEEFSIAEEYNRDLACLIFDIDKFKLINDSYGHLAGDMVMKHIVKICNDNIEIDDIIGRFGGDEFVIILIGKKADHAKMLAEKIIELLRKTSVIVNDSVIYTSISIGITDNKIGYPKNGEDMIRIADKALYKAKENGRDQYCIACE